MKTVIVVSSHKAYWTPADPVYLPVQVGGGPDLGPQWHRDNTGEQISDKNAYFCELTALYWAWKNVDCDALGLVHYRRYLGSPRRRFGDRRSRVLTGPEAEALLQKADVILPVKRHYWIETRASQYAHAHHAEDLRCVEAILAERYPEYLPAWRWMEQSRSGHICNLFLMRRGLLNDYCEWLFDILFEAERRLDISQYSPKDARVFGYLGERLLDVWIRHHGLSSLEVPVVLLESQHWLKKGLDFLRRKWQAAGR